MKRNSKKPKVHHTYQQILLEPEEPEFEFKYEEVHPT